MHLIFPITENIDYPESSIKLTVFDILRMKIDIWARAKSREDLKSITGFLPNNIYKRAIACKEFLDTKFPDFKVDFEYAKHRNLMLDFYADKNFMEEEAFNDYLNHGFESVDLELVNAAVARNEALAINLPENGANPATDIFNSDAMINLMEDFNEYDYLDIFSSLSDLYAAASTCKMLLLIDFYKVIE